MAISKFRSDVDEFDFSQVSTTQSPGHQAFHFMRDHPDHGTVILGGGWGWRATPQTRLQWQQAWGRALRDRMAWEGRDKWGADQTMLRRLMFLSSLTLY